MSRYAGYLLIFFALAIGSVVTAMVMTIEETPREVVIEKPVYILADSSLIRALDRQTDAINTQTDAIGNWHTDMERWHRKRIQIHRDQFHNYINH